MEDAVPQSAPVQAPAPTPAPRRVGMPRLTATGWIALGIAAIVVVATAVVLLAGNQAQASYPADSPEAALQGYLTAWYDDDYDTAYGFFSSGAQGQMLLFDFRQQAGYSYGPDNQTVTLDRTTGSGDARTLYLSVEDSYGPEFGGGGYTHDVQVRMVLEPGGWKIDDPLVGLEPYYGSFPF